jgi:hypothetical protein
MLSVIMLSVAFHSLLCYECRYAECHYAECRYPECRGASLNPSMKSLQIYVFGIFSAVQKVNHVVM